MKKSSVKYFLVLIMLLFNVSVVWADTDGNAVDFVKKGSIEIVLSEVKTGEKVSGAELVIYKLADASLKDANLIFEYSECLLEYQEELDYGVISSEVLQIIESEKLSSFSGVTNTSGELTFQDLELGLYLVVQANQVEGYSKMEPFTVMIPQVYENVWVYDIEAMPKMDIIRLFDLMVEKVWNVDSTTKIPSKITVELLRKGEVIDTITLSSENNWTYTWRQIEMSDEYSVFEKDVPEGYTVSYREQGNLFVITNTKELVQTGRSMWISVLGALVGIFLISFGIILNQGKHYE